MIVGIQESFIDYPDHICVMIFTQTCKWDCTNCHNKQNLLNSSELTIKYVLDYLENSKPLIHHVTISGGEPTDDPDILKLVSLIKDLGFDIKLDTNGSNPKVLKSLLPNLSVVAMDVKEVVDSYEKYHRVTKCTKDQYMNVLMSLELLSDWSKSASNHLILRTTLFDNYINTDDVKYSLSKYHFDEYIIQDQLL